MNHNQKYVRYRISNIKLLFKVYINIGKVGVIRTLKIHVLVRKYWHFVMCEHTVCMHMVKSEILSYVVQKTHNRHDLRIVCSHVIIN